MMVINKKGAALIWAVVFCSVLILISTTIAGYILKDSRFSYKIGESYNVYSAAKSGVAWGQKFVEIKGGASKLDPYPVTKSQTFDLDGALVNVIIVKSDDSSESECPDSDYLYCIESLATQDVSNVTRKMTFKSRKYTWDRKITSSYDNLGDNDQVFYDGNESFGFQLDFWGGDALSNWNMGFVDPDPEIESEIYINFADEGISIAAKHPEAFGVGEVIQSNMIVIDDTSEIDQNYKFRANLEYIKNTSAILTIRERVIDPVTFEYGFNCIGQVSLNLASVDFGDFENIRTIPRFEKIDFEGYDASESGVFKSTNPNSDIYLSNIELRSMKVRDY